MTENLNHTDQLIIENLERGFKIVNPDLIHTRIPVKKIFVNCSKSEASSLKSERLFKLAFKGEKSLEASHKVTSKVKNRGQF
jgi:hypothetical protein